MNPEIIAALDQLESEKGISKAYMLDRIAQALLAAYRRDTTGYSKNVDVRVVGEEIKVYAEKEVVEEVMFPRTEVSLEDARKDNPDCEIGDVVSVENDMAQFGRIAAQTAKGVIIQGIREAERNATFGKYSSKSHEMLTGTVLSIDPEKNEMVVRIGSGTDKTDAHMPESEQVPEENYKEGDIIRVYVVDVRKNAKGIPQMTVSRTHPGLVKRLFEVEVPEIEDGTVEIRSIAREAGSRTKMAVWSSDPSVDPVGTCVGPRGGRVGSVVNELNGEKIDIIKYSEDPAEFVAAALAPADVLDVVPQTGTKNCRVVVPDDQLSLAIGKEGQNARLAARLTGFKIDIKSESAAELLEMEEAEQAADAEAEYVEAFDAPQEGESGVVAGETAEETEQVTDGVQEIQALELRESEEEENL